MPAMLHRRRWKPGPLSLKTRFSLAVAILIVLCTAVLTVAAAMIVQRGMEGVISEREAAVIGQVARDLDHKIVLRQNALLRLAGDLERAGAVTGEDFQRELDQHHSLSGLFSNLSVVSAKGEHLANMDQPKSDAKRDFSRREWFIDTMRSDRPVISAPLLSAISGRPVVVMTAPMHGANGRIDFILTGALELGQESFLSELAMDRIGTTGYFYLMTRTGVLISHPDETRLLTNMNEGPRRMPLVERALEGAEGTQRGLTDQGFDALISYKRMASTGWMLSAVYPTAEAFAFAGQMQLNAVIIALTLLLVLVPAAWLLVDKQLLPLTRLGERMRAGRDAAPPPADYQDDEIGDLWRAFDALMAERDQAERAMANSEKKLRLVTDNVPALVGYIDTDERFVFGNERYLAFFGFTGSQLAGRTAREVVGETVYALSKPYIDAALSGRTVLFERQVMRQGVQKWDRVAYNPDIDEAGVVQGYFVLVNDITELKTTELTLAMSEKRIRTIADNMPALIGYIDTELRYRFCNSAYTIVTGISPENIVGRTVSEVFGPAAFAAVAGHMAEALCGKKVSFERFATEFAEHKYLQTEYIPDIGPDGQVTGFYTMVTDISRRKNTELALAKQQRLLHTVTDNLPALINFIDRDGRFGFVNRSHQGWFGQPLEALVGADVASLLTPAGAEAHLAAFGEAMTGKITKWEFPRTHHGETRHYHATYIPQIETNGEVIGVTGLVNDVTDAKLLEQQLSAMARFDSLTGLPNRSHIMERIERAQMRSARSGHPLAVMYLDLDNFKSINDNFGHAGGDAVLIEFGRRLGACVRQSDTVGRLAGDEFVILLEGLHDASECAVVARKVIKVMEKPFDIEGVARIVSTSIGVATANGGTASTLSLLKHADDALYRAKETGRNCFSMTSMK